MSNILIQPFLLELSLRLDLGIEEKFIFCNRSWDTSLFGINTEITWVPVRHFCIFVMLMYRVVNTQVTVWHPFMH